jgi:hypothetical protein
MLFPVVAIFVSAIYSSISVEKPWLTILEPQSPEYLEQLYCGTVARGRINIGENRSQTPVDAVGFAQGVEEILKRSKIESQPFLNEAERDWIRSETWSLFKAWFLGRTLKIKQSLFRMGISLGKLKTNDIKPGISLASLLDKANKHEPILDPLIQSETMQYLKSLPRTPDKLCEDLRESLVKFVESTVSIPDFKDREDIKRAIERSYKFFPSQRDLLGYYAFAEYLEYEKTKSPDSQIRLITALEMLCKKYPNSVSHAMRGFPERPFIENSTTYTRAILDAILENLRKNGDHLRKRAKELLSFLDLDPADQNIYILYRDGNIFMIKESPYHWKGF